jgi:hypothetical protein
VPIAARQGDRVGRPRRLRGAEAMDRGLLGRLPDSLLTADTHVIAGDDWSHHAQNLERPH